MAQTLGEKLRQAREERGVSISEVAEQTRISPLYIDCIEKDNYKPLPGGIFNKGFIKSYAKYVGVDEQDALRDYAELMAHTEDAEPEQPRSYRPEVLTDERPISAMMPTIIIAGVMLAVMSTAILLLVNYVWSRRSQPAVVSNTANTQSSTPEQTAQVEEPAPAQGFSNFESSKIELRVSDSVYLSSTVDGKSSETQVEPAQAAEFAPKESLRLRYHVSRVNFVTLLLNGKQIELPKEPANPKRSTIELEINKNNFAEIWQSGRYTPPQGASTVTTPRPASSPRPTAGAKPSPTPVKLGPPPTPRPGNATARPTPR